MRRIGERFAIDGEKIIKISSGEEIPEDEPIILFRARDRMALPMLYFYRGLLVEDRIDIEQLKSLDEMIQKFVKYSMQNPTKQPGITKGLPWDGTPS